MAVATKTRMIACATSFDTFHSTIEHRASIEKGTQSLLICCVSPSG
jgi:cystathionine gamma-synthase